MSAIPRSNTFFNPTSIFMRQLPTLVFIERSEEGKLYGLRKVIAIAMILKISIIRPGHSCLLEFEKKVVPGCLIETFSKYQDLVV